MNTTEELCPCGSGKKYSECCEPVIKGTSLAKTAEDLMRARYTSYVKDEIDFIAKSCFRDKDEGEIDIDETRAWAEESTWHGLKILSTSKGKETDTEGVVEFTATYTRKGLRDVHKEQANFKKVNGEWLYTTGNLIPTTIIREGNKVGRNDPCPCGSGKKFKKCCGK